MKLPGYVAQLNMPDESGVPKVPASAFGSDVYNALGHTGKALFDAVDDAEQQKAEAQRSSEYMDAIQRAGAAYKDFEINQFTNPDSRTHVAGREEWSKKFNDELIGSITDPIVKKAVIQKVGGMRLDSIVDARAQARTLANSEMKQSADALTKGAIEASHGAGFGDESLNAAAINMIKTRAKLFVDSGFMLADKAAEMEQADLAAFYKGGIQAMMMADQDRAYRYVRTNEDARKALGSTDTYTLERATLGQIVEWENLQHTRLERKSEVTKSLLDRQVLAIKSPDDAKAAQASVDEAQRTGELSAPHASQLSKDIFTMQTGGGKSDPDKVADMEFALYRSSGAGVGLAEIRAGLGNGLDSKDVTRLLSLKESLEGSNSTMTQARSYLEKMVMPGMMEKITQAHRAKLNIVMQELDAETNRGNMPREKIWDKTFKIADRLARSKERMYGTSVFRSIRDLDKAFREGKISPDDVEGFAEALPIPPELIDPDPLKSWKKISIEWRDGKMSEEVAMALYYRLFPQALQKVGGGKK